MMRQRSARGSALVFAMGFMTVVLVIALGVHALVDAELRSSARLRQRVAATYLAEGGLARAQAWFNTRGYQLPQSTLLTASVPVVLDANGEPVELPGNHPDRYTDTQGSTQAGVVDGFNQYLTAQHAGGGSYDVTAALMGLQPETWQVLARARVGNVESGVGGLLVREQETLFNDALFGRDEIRLTGNAYTDSYDSSAGLYGDGNRSQGGHVRSNGNISLTGNAAVRGDAVPGPNQNVQLTGNASVTGSTTPAGSSRTLPPASVPADAVNLGNVMVSGNQTQTLSTGTYVLSSLSISGNGRLIVNAATGPVHLYVTGAVSVAGNGISNGSGNPSNLFLAQVGGADVAFSGNANFYGAVYAPESALSISGNGALYGAFAGQSISVLGNAAIHYDRSLQALAGAPGPLRLVAQWNVPS